MLRGVKMMGFKVEIIFLGVLKVKNYATLISPAWEHSVSLQPLFGASSVIQA